MPNTLRGTTIYQWGAESTKGTAVAATSKILVEEMDFIPQDEIYRPTFINGVLLQNTGNEQAITRGTDWRASGPFSYQQAIHWFEMAIQGAVTPSGAGPYTWTFTRNATSIPTIDSFTFERRLNDGANSIDNEWAYGMLSELKLSGSPRGMVMYEASGFARRVQSSTLTAALSLPTTTLMPHGTSSLFIDTTFAGVGTTQVSSQLIDWSLTLRPGHMPLFTADGRSDLDYPTHMLNSDQVGLEFEATLLVPGSSSQYATEKTAAEAATLRAVQIKTTGAAPFDMEIDFLAKHERGSVFSIGTQDGQNVVKLNMVGSTDATNFLRAIVINSTATDA